VHAARHYAEAMPSEEVGSLLATAEAPRQESAA
jgi:hypothetical protein